jgi:hypothetical protein
MQAGRLSKLQETKGAKEEVRAAEEILIVQREEEETMEITKVVETEVEGTTEVEDKVRGKVAARKREDNINSVGLAVLIKLK